MSVVTVLVVKEDEEAHCLAVSYELRGVDGRLKGLFRK